jgi:polygalacturonase
MRLGWKAMAGRAIMAVASLAGLALASTAGGPAGMLPVLAVTSASAAAVAAPAPAAGPAALRRPAFNVLNYGATGNGTSNDAPAINAAIAAASAAGGGIVEFPAGQYLAGGSIHMMSNITLDLEAGSTIMGAATGYDPPEPNPYDQYQDFGHSHFHDAMIWGNDLTNIGFVGSGTIDGEGNLVSGTPKTGQADKIISLTRCRNLTVSGITLKNGGHFAMLIDDCDHVTSDHLTISTAADRDGWNIIDTRNVKISDINVSSNDDALVFKSDWALGQTFSSGNVIVDHAVLSSQCCNALMFGSETCGNFTNYHFSNITVTDAGKSGLGMVSEDGANISHVYYDHITMSGTQSPIMEKIGTRLRCGGTPTVGSIRDIHYDNITGTDAGAFSPTLWGQPGHPVSDITFNNVHLTLPGGHAAMDPNTVPTDNGDYNPNSLGTRPAYGFYLHNVSGIQFTDSSVSTVAADARPAFIANDGSSVTFRDVTAQSGSGSPFDAGFQDIAGYCLVGSHTSTGGPVRISTPDSTPAKAAGCNAGLSNFTLAAQPSSATVTAGSSGTYTVGTAVAAGRPGPVRLSASGLPPGSSASFSPNPVRPGAISVMTVTVPAASRNGTYPLEVTGSDAAATQYADVGLTITGGAALSVTGLSVADPANAGAWSVQQDLQPGEEMYGDRTFTVASVPAGLAGATWIRTANASKTVTTDPLVSFTINVPAMVSVAVDTRLGRRPWMDSSWADTGLQLTDTEGSSTRTFEVYQKAFQAGTVTLGPDADTANSASMYTIIVS